jgi:Right handed beta helix region
VLICQNQIQNNNQPGAAAGDGIYTDQFVSGGAVTNVLVENNAFKGNDDAGIDISNTDVANGVSNLEVRTNTFDMNGRGVLFFNTHMSSVHNNSITNSTLVGSAAIRIFDNNSDLSITFNDIDTGAGHGIRLSDIDAVDVGNPNPSSGVVINDNNIVNFSAGDGLLVDAASHVGTVNAECNWWGATDGPSGDGPGSGSAAVGDADFTPWLVAASPAPATGTVDCSGGAPTTTTTTTAASTTTSTTTTTVPTCGDNVIQPPEQCDPPGSPQCPGATPEGTTDCLANCTCCVPQPENTSTACGNMVDDDCDGLIDCADPDCTGIFPCPRASKDPTIIQFGRAGSLDRIRGHAKLQMAPVDLTAMPLSVLLSDLHGAIYSNGLPAGALIGNPTGTIFRFRNAEARTSGGTYDLKIKKNNDGRSYTFSFTSYGNLSAATNANMRLQFYIGDDANAAREGRVFITLDTPWTKTAHGWRAPKDH